MPPRFWPICPSHCHTSLAGASTVTARVMTVAGSGTHSSPGSSARHSALVAPQLRSVRRAATRRAAAPPVVSSFDATLWRPRTVAPRRADNDLGAASGRSACRQLVEVRTSVALHSVERGPNPQRVVVAVAEFGVIDVDDAELSYRYDDSLRVRPTLY